jgi:ADYC domain-containing protein
MPKRLPLLCLIAALAGDVTARAAESTVVGIEASGTAFRATLSDGSVKQGMELSGAVLVFKVKDAVMRIRIASVAPDPTDKTGSVLLHDFRIADTGEPLCSPAPDGTRLGFPLAGRTAKDERFVEAAPGVFELICTAGGQGKCVRFGYHPWETAPDGRPMRDYYNACVRMLRADYCGDGHGWTRDGTLVDLWDDHGIQVRDADAAALSFEAGWASDGTVCVAHSRVPENISVDKLKAYCPRLAAIPSCDESDARSAGALIFNRSKEMAR